MKAFRLENPDDFPAGSDETEQMDEIVEVLQAIEEHGTDQAGGFGSVRFNFNNKSIARENLRELLNDISIIAGTLAYKIPGIDLIFHVPKNQADAALLALARSFVEQTPKYQTDFLRRGLNASFMSDLQAAITAFEDSLTPPEMATNAQVEATARLGEAVRRGMIARDILKGIMKIKYKNDPGKTRAWMSASHIERDNRPEEPLNVG